MMLNLLEPGTINSDDEVDNYSDSASESENERKPKIKKKGKDSDFFDDFLFVDSVKEYQRDTWNDVLKYMKKGKYSYDIDAKIAQVRREAKESSKLKNINSVSVKEEESDEDIISTDGSKSNDEEDSDVLPEDERKPDTLRVKEVDALRKEKQKLQKRKREKKLQKENPNFFEDAPPFDTDATFQEMNLSRPLLKAISSMNYDHPTPIQASTVPVALLGRDICGCASTGTGKTAAFMLPILERLIYRPPGDIVTRVLVLTPTRELGVQVSKQLAQLTQIDIALSVGGLDLRTQEVALRKNPDIVIATPGRLLDHLQNTLGFGLENIEILVLDEADRMLDEYFCEQMKEIIKQCCPTRQTMLFSATMTDEVKDLAAVSLKNPVKIFVNSNTDVAQNLRQEYTKLRKNGEEDREAALLLHIMLGLCGVRVGELHGNMNQTQRLMALKKFSDAEIDILLATDVAGRGLDIKGVKTVINFTLPSSYQRYVHRVGRTARAGLFGRSVSLFGDSEYKMLKEIKKESNSPMFERILDPDILNKYRQKVMKVEADVSRVLKEEKEEKQFQNMSKEIDNLERKIKQPKESRPERLWFQSDVEKKKEKRRLLELSGVEFKSRKKKKREQAMLSSAESRIQRELDVATRIAKSCSKLKKLGGENLRVNKPDLAKLQKASKQKKLKQRDKSFAKELTKIDPKSVKKYRYTPPDARSKNNKRKKKKF